MRLENPQEYLALTFIHSVFTAFLIYKHGNSLHYHGNPYIITKASIRFP